VSTSLGEFVIELYIPDCTLGCLNFIGDCVRKSYDKINIEKVEYGHFFQVSVATDIDETVWATPIAYDRDTAHRSFTSLPLASSSPPSWST
jgi:cyclophilin family peptidyl-prolyl cis-trans isomerase